MFDKFSTLGRATTFGFVLLLSACGGGGGSNGSSGSGGNQPNTGGQSAGGDSFISRVMSVIGNSSDTAEPIDVKPIQATTPENTEPVPVS